MKKIEVYDPPMCCSTGVCGPTVDPKLARFAGDLQWLAGKGVDVQRFNLGQQPHAFAASAVVKGALESSGNECLPLIVADGAVASAGEYPSRERLAEIAGLQIPLSIFTDAVAELVALGAAVAANCEPCFKHHFQQARKLGVSREDMMRAVQTAQSVKEAPAKAMLDLAHRFLDGDSVSLPVMQTTKSSCCG